MRYLAILDKYNLSNKLFITNFAHRLQQQEKSRSVILHGDSEYTETLIQTGMMRNDAKIRATRELNRRLVALLADEGVAAIGLNGYQRDTIFYDGQNLEINTGYLNTLPDEPALLISNVACHPDDDSLVIVPIAQLANQLATRLQLDEIITFKVKKNDQTASQIPDELQNAAFSHRNIELKNFNNLSLLSKITLTTP